MSGLSTDTTVPPWPTPDDVGPKEVYAHFGLAAYHAQILEVAVIQLAVVMAVSGRSDVTRSVVDSLFNKFERQTLGRLIAELKKLPDYPESLGSELMVALTNRNLLTHGFFYSHAEDFLTDEGRMRMLDHIRAIALTLMSTANELEQLFFKSARRLGITEERVAEELATVVKASQAGGPAA